LDCHRGTEATEKMEPGKRELRMYPPPGCFWKRGCKRLKTKDGGRKLKTKRLQAIERTRVRSGVAGGVSEVSA
jgi:hypothetical protein